MATETIAIDGVEVVTLQELLRPGLRAIVVGINPSPVSVKAGHYYQGKLGKLFWKRLQLAGIVEKLTPGREDLDAFAQGVGFADVLRYPTPNAELIDSTELRRAVPDLESRLASTGCKRLLFVFTKAWSAARQLESRGYQLFRMPSPYARQADVEHQLATLGRVLSPQMRT
jgi:double-stranded uracil-DNA glycosylase